MPLFPREAYFHDTRKEISRTSSTTFQSGISKFGIPSPKLEESHWWILYEKALWAACDWGKSTLMSSKAAVVSNHFTLIFSTASQETVKGFDPFELESQMRVSLQCDWLKDLPHLAEDSCVKWLNVSHGWIWKRPTDSVKSAFLNWKSQFTPASEFQNLLICRPTTGLKTSDVNLVHFTDHLCAFKIWPPLSECFQWIICDTDTFDEFDRF